MKNNPRKQLKRTLSKMVTVIETQPSDTEMLDWLQRGHCVLPLCVFGSNNKCEESTVIEFEIDGYQDCPKDIDLRKAIACAMVLDRGVKNL